jgi:hypothetical protein
VGLFGLESSQSSIRFGCTHYRRKLRWLTRPGQFEAQADPNLGAAARTHGDARSTQRRMSSRNTRPARPVRGCPWNSRRCTPTVLAAGRCPLYVHAHGHIGGRLHGQPRTRSAEPADLCKPAGRTLCPRAHPAKADVRRGKADEPLTGGGYHPMPGIPGLGRLFRHR